MVGGWGGRGRRRGTSRVAREDGDARAEAGKMGGPVGGTEVAAVGNCGYGSYDRGIGGKGSLLSCPPVASSASQVAVPPQGAPHHHHRCCFVCQQPLRSSPLQSPLRYAPRHSGRPGCHLQPLHLHQRRGGPALVPDPHRLPRRHHLPGRPPASSGRVTSSFHVLSLPLSHRHHAYCWWCHIAINCK